MKKNHSARRKMNFFRVLCVIVLGTLSAFAASGRITGHVVDAVTGESLIGVNVVLVEKWENNDALSLSTPQGAATDVNGYYAILNVSPGLYNIAATMIGYGQLKKTEVRVSFDHTTVVDFEMSVEALKGDAVVVQAERKIIKADVYGTVESIASEKITDAPYERVDEFIDKMKGVKLVDDASGHGLSIRGGDIRETDIMVDNISIRDTRSENSYINFNASTIEEIQVKTGGFEAKYGGIQSGLVNVITKEGSRDKYSLSMEVTTVPAGQERFFACNHPWSEDSPLYETFLGDYAMNGIPDSVYGVPEGSVSGMIIPDEFPFKDFKGGFRGWSYRRAFPTTISDSLRRKLWEVQHPTYDIAAKPDYYIEGALMGPVPGAWIPFIGNVLGKTTFLLGGKYESSQFAFPIGPRDAYEDWNSQLKLTTRLTSKTKIILNTMYAKISTINEGRISDYGGALIDNSARFNFLSNTESSVSRQAGLIGGTSFYRIFNKSRFQMYDKQFILGGLTVSHQMSANSFFNIEANFRYSDNKLTPYVMDTGDIDNWVLLSDNATLNLDSLFYVYLPDQEDSLGIYHPDVYVDYFYASGAPNGNATPTYDQINFFELAGGVPAKDSSYTMMYQLKGELTNRINERHQIESGFDFRYHDIFVYSGYGWSQTSYPLNLFQYYRVHPIELGLFIQDRLSYEGFIATLGLRADYFNALRLGYEVSHTLDEGFRELSNYYWDLPGDIDSYEKWKAYREVLDNPPGWPERDTKGVFALSPRLGASFPISIKSKLYFNYGHFYQRAPISFIYNTTTGSVPNPDLDFEKTVAFEFGYEQIFLRNYLFNIAFYYKDVQNRPLAQTYINYYEDLQVTKYMSDGYRDIRGLELRLEKNVGRFFNFWANYDYQVISSGQTGLAYVYENQLKAEEEIRFSNQYTAQARPGIDGSVSLRTPVKWGSQLFGIYPLAGYSANFIFSWQDGGYAIWNPSETNPDKQIRVDIVDYTNIDLRVIKRLFGGKAEVFVSVKNLLNNKRLTTSNMLPDQSERYKNSLRLPFKGGVYKGDDQWGDFRPEGVAFDPLEELIDPADLDYAAYTADEIDAMNDGIEERNEVRIDKKSYIDTGWYETPIFLNPRRISVGLRIKL